MKENRRQFLKTTATLTAISRGRILGANERVRIGAIGTGGRCRHLLSLLNKVGGNEIVAVCDVYEPRWQEAREKYAGGAKHYLDYRQLLEQSDIDAVVIGSPDHWHVPMTVDAVHAGKDVYVEKPVTHTIEQGDVLHKAVTESKQVVQVGYQQRSWDIFQMAHDLIGAGKLGKVALVLSYWYQNYLRRGDPPQVDTGKLDWKRWLGAAPERPFDVYRFRYWRWYWDYGGGALTDLFSHWVDSIHWAMGADTPLAAEATGGLYALTRFECPDTINAAYQYPGFAVVYNGTIIGGLEGGGIVFRGSEAMMRLSRDGLAVYNEGTVPAEKTQYPEPVIQARATRDGTFDHVKNFLDCVRSRNTPNAGIISSIAAARSAHLGNRAYRQERRVS